MWRRKARYHEFQSAFKRAWSLCMAPADVAAFSDALRGAFPEMRFVSRRYWTPFVDWERFKEDCRRHEWQWKNKLPYDRVVYHWPQGPGDSLHYWSSLTDLRETDFWAWIEPPGWRPEWGPPNAFGEREIENMPPLRFLFERSRYCVGWPGSSRAFNDEPLDLPSRQMVVLQGETFEIRFNRYDANEEAFAKAVFKILRKLTVHRFFSVDTRILKAYPGEPWGGPAFSLAGHHADAWTLKRRHNYLRGPCGGPLFKSARYKFRRGAVFTEAECAALRAKTEAKFQAGLKRLQEESKRRSLAWRKRKHLGPPEMQILVSGTGIFRGIQKNWDSQKWRFTDDD